MLSAWRMPHDLPTPARWARGVYPIMTLQAGVYLGRVPNGGGGPAFRWTSVTGGTALHLALRFEHPIHLLPDGAGALQASGEILQ